MFDFVLTSQLKVEYYDELEKLFFFNTRQSRLTEQITKAVSDFGSPQLVNNNGYLRIHIGKMDDVQTLYAMQSTDSRPALIGVLVYYRRSSTEITVLHSALDHEYLRQAGLASDFVFVEILRRFRWKLRQVKGMELLSFCYTTYRFRIH